MTTNDNINKPNLFLCSLILPIIWLGVGIVISNLLPEIRLGVAGLFVISYSAVAVVCWRFAKKGIYEFSKSEKIRLIFYFTLWAACCEFMVLFYLISQDSSSVSTTFFLSVLTVTTLLDALVIASAVYFFSKPVFKSLMPGEKV